MTEEQLLEMVNEFPDSPMGAFSLGKHYLEHQRPADAAARLEDAVRLDPAYTAAHVSLGDAYSALGKSELARKAWNAALATPHGKRDASLQEDLEQRLSELD